MIIAKLWDSEEYRSTSGASSSGTSAVLMTKLSDGLRTENGTGVKIIIKYGMMKCKASDVCYLVIYFWVFLWF